MATHEAVFHHLLRQTEADGELRRRASSSATTAAFEPLAHLILHEVVQIPDGSHAGALVDGGFDFRRDRDVLDDEAPI
jgi:hypothetical protein